MINYIIIACAALTAFYLYATRTFKYWERRGVKHEKPVLIFGNFASNVLAKKSITQFMEDLYWKYPEEKIVGFYRFSHPELLIRDPDIIKRIFTTDFHCFYARGFLETDPDHNNLEILRKHLFVVEGDMWKVLRQGTSPAFTSGKLKAMFPLIIERAERLQERTRAISGKTTDVRDVMARYTTDFISACGLGIDADSQKKEDSVFRELGEKIFEVGIKDVIVVFLKSFFPLLFRKLRCLAKVEKEFCELVYEILRQRNHKPSGRNDFIDMMLEIKEKGKIVCESMNKTKPGNFTMEMDYPLIAAQAFVFFGAGFETSSSATSYMLHEIAYNPEEQKKIQADIDRVLAKYNNKLSYDSIKEMRYLEWAFMEGIRMLPPAGILVRICRQKCYFEELGLTIEESTRIVISAQGLNRDPKYWDRPEEFRPERFSPQINEPKHDFVFLPFGAGPRTCIGERLGLMQSLAGLAAILSNFNVSPAPTSVRHPIVDPKCNLVQSIVGGLPVIFTPRKKQIRNAKNNE